MVIDLATQFLSDFTMKPAEKVTETQEEEEGFEDF